MNKKEEKDVEKSLEKLFEKDREEIGVRMAMDFFNKNKREPTEKEMLKIINEAGQKVADLWNKYPENFKWVKKNVR